jgi:hypothetical protein
MSLYPDLVRVDKLKDKPIYQIAVVREGWGWLYTHEELAADQLHLQYRDKEMKILCENFNMKLVSGAEATVCISVWETDECYTFEGEAEALSLYKRHEEDCPTVQDNLTVKRVRFLLDKLWTEYQEEAAQLDWVDEYNQGTYEVRGDLY